MAKLILRKEDGSESEHPVDESGSASIGRSPECDIPIDDQQASRRHCSVVRVSNGFEMTDLGSTNGTLVNSTLQKRKLLSHGDVIRIGATEIVFHDMDHAEASEQPGHGGVLVYAKGDRKGEKIALTDQRTTFGRKESNTIVLGDVNASSYHCEIVRDLNGYTIRDLGSTNGTLVNGEMITEAQLTHGSKVRVGQILFVFQDSAMAEIDLDLAGVEDDDQEWGMMRELDLAAVRKRNPATIVYSILFVAIIGGLAYLLSQGPTKGGNRGPKAPPGALAWSSFESAVDAFSWDTEPPGDVGAEVTQSVKGEGKSALKLTPRQDGVDVFFEDSIDGERARYEVEAKLGATGGAQASLAILWRSGTLQRWSETAPVTGGDLKRVKGTFSAPLWASTAMPAVRIQGRGTVYMDDFVVLRRGSTEPQVVDQNNFQFSVVDGRWVDVTHAGAPILANGRLLARDADGGPLDASGMTIRGAPVDDLHVRMTIENIPEGAASVGLHFQGVRGYLGKGFRAFGTDEAGVRFLVSSFPDAGSSEVRDGFRKLLLGSSGRAFAILGGAEDAQLRVEARWDGRRRGFDVLVAPSDGKAEFRVKTNLSGESVQASRQMSHASTLFKDEDYGEFLNLARETLTEFPFANPNGRQKLSENLRTAIQRWEHLARTGSDGLAEYREFKDRESLQRVREALEEMVRKFGIVPGKGVWGERYQTLFDNESKLRLAASRKRQGDLAAPLLQQATQLHLALGEIYSASVLLSYISQYLPASPQAERAAAELKKLESQNPQVLEVLKRLKEE